jgi:hypothetical protein
MSVYDLFAIGLGLDFAGAALLAKGLLSSPSDVVHRMVNTRNTFAMDIVRAAEDRADGEAGVAALCLGFLIQTIAYVVILDIRARTAEGASASLVAGSSAVVAAALVLTIGRSFRWLRVRAFLVEVARDSGAGRRDQPDVHELATYGRILKRGPRILNSSNGQEEDLDQYAHRVWKVDMSR